MVLSQIRKWTRREKTIAVAILGAFSIVGIFLFEANTLTKNSPSPPPQNRRTGIPSHKGRGDFRDSFKTAGVEQRGLALPLTVYRDNFLGISIRIPEGWRINATQGKILVKREPQAWAGAIVYPVLLKQSMKAEEFLKSCFGIYQKIYQAHQGQLQLEALNAHGGLAQGRFSGVLGKLQIVGEVTAKVEGRRGDYRAHWAPVEDWPMLKEALQVVVESFETFQSEPLKIYQGNVFQIYHPEGWQISESLNGIDAYDPLDQTMVSVGLLVYTPGNPNPIQLMDYNLHQTGIQNGLILRQKEYPSTQDAMGQPWKIVGREMEYDWKGRHYRASLTSGVVQQYLSFSGMLSIRQAPLERWEAVAALLETIEKSFKILRPDRLGGGVKSIVLPTNHPADTSSIMESWESANTAKDEVDKGWSEYMQGGGYRTSEKTGEDVWVTPQDYDPGRGGYINPNDDSDLILDS